MDLLEWPKRVVGGVFYPRWSVLHLLTDINGKGKKRVCMDAGPTRIQQWHFISSFF